MRPGPVVASDAEVRDRLQAILDRYVNQCTRDLFAAHSVELSVSQPCDLTAYSLAGVIGLVGDLSGTLLLGCDVGLIDESHPLRTTKPRISSYERFDWIGELANQMAGRLKKRLAAHGLAFEFSPPISLAGERVHHVAANGHTHRSSFHASVAQLGVWIDVAMNDAVGARPEFFADHEAASLEGTVILF